MLDHARLLDGVATPESVKSCMAIILPEYPEHCDDIKDLKYKESNVDKEDTNSMQANPNRSAEESRCIIDLDGIEVLRLEP